MMFTALLVYCQFRAGETQLQLFFHMDPKVFPTNGGKTSETILWNAAYSNMNPVQSFPSIFSFCTTLQRETCCFFHLKQKKQNKYDLFLNHKLLNSLYETFNQAEVRIYKTKYAKQNTFPGKKHPCFYSHI